jgi:hypothetical protein
VVVNIVVGCVIAAVEVFPIDVTIVVKTVVDFGICKFVSGSNLSPGESGGPFTVTVVVVPLLVVFVRVVAGGGFVTMQEQISLRISSGMPEK